MMTQKAVKANSFNMDYRNLNLKILHDHDDSQSVLAYILLLSVANLRKLIWSLSAFFDGLQICFARQCYVA